MTMSAIIRFWHATSPSSTLNGSELVRFEIDESGSSPLVIGEGPDGGYYEFHLDDIVSIDVFDSDGTLIATLEQPDDSSS